MSGYSHCYFYFYPFVIFSLLLHKQYLRNRIIINTKHIFMKHTFKNLFKTTSTKLRQLSLRFKQQAQIVLLITWEIIKYTLLWVANFYFVFISPTSKPRVFKGFGHWWLAKQYADRRSNLTKINKLCGGKRFFVLPYTQDSLIVVDRMEIITGKNRGIFNKSLNIEKLLKNAYYITK